MKTFSEYLNEDIHAYAKKHGVTLNLDKHFEKNAYHLQWIDNGGNKGAGRKVMDKLHSYADKNKKDIHLVAHGSHPKLVNHYSKMGYENRGETDDGTYMVRKAKKK